MNTRLDIASRLLSSVICQDRNRSVETRVSDVMHCIALADLLIEKCSETAAVAYEIPAPTTPTDRATDEAIERVAIKNAKAAFAERVERRQLLGRSNPSGEASRPTLH
jgi:hypothetical protein